MIEFINIKKSFDGHRVLSGVDLKIEKGLVTAIIGGSGTGKSVLLKHIIGLIKPDGGKVIVDGEDIASLSYSELVRLRQKISMVFQNSALFDSLSVGENLSMGIKRHTRLKRSEIDKEVSRALELVGLKGIEDKFPAELSGGMRKRVAIARALVIKPDILLYDEPTTGLDPPRAESINKLISGLNEKLGITSVVVTHDMYSMFQVADQTAMLYDGVIRFYGAPEQIAVSTDPVIREFLKSASGCKWLFNYNRQEEEYATAQI
ncbi:ABC transporter ATP-binding protein [candidate division KSB1 bacterium RBG_16_48_16]|nr:MAG: ABC transporter ATP-binding protein [candidate division KSB1 bacterium RBG_16_48_16]